MLGPARTQSVTGLLPRPSSYGTGGIVGFVNRAPGRVPCAPNRTGKTRKKTPIAPIRRTKLKASTKRTTRASERAGKGSLTNEPCSMMWSES